MLGEENLRKRYPAKTIMNNCISMYNDPNWIFEGKNLFDAKYSFDINDKLKSKIQSFLKIGPNKFLVNFQVCSDLISKSKNLLITTDREQFLGTILHPKPDFCQNFWVLLRAENPENSKFSWYYGDVSDFHLVRKLK